MGSSCMLFLCVIATPCPPMPLLVHFRRMSAMPVTSGRRSLRERWLINAGPWKVLRESRLRSPLFEDAVDPWVPFPIILVGGEQLHRRTGQVVEFMLLPTTLRNRPWELNKERRLSLFDTYHHTRTCLCVYLYYVPILRATHRIPHTASCDVHTHTPAPNKFCKPRSAPFRARKMLCKPCWALAWM